MKSKHEILADLLSDDSFVRWIKGEASQEEQVRWNEWLRADAERKQWVRQAQRMYRLPFEQVDENDTDAQLHRLQKAIDKHESKRLYPAQRGGRSGRRRKWSVYAAVASVVLILGISFALFRGGNVADMDTENMVALQTDYGQKDSLRLADGSLVILNANTTLRYHPEGIASSNVRMELEGEAYFDIIHNPDRKLVVRTDDGLIEDIGTKFNVNTRARVTRVALVEGKVKITKRSSDGGTPSSYEAIPGDFIQFSDTGASIAVSQSNLDVHTSWVQDKLVLDDTPFRDIVAKLEQTYGVDIEVDDQDLMDRKVSGSIRSPNLEIVLQGLAQTMRLNVRRSGEKIFISSKERE